MNKGHLYFNNLGDLLIFTMKVHINESSMANILYFAEVINIAGVHTNMDTSKEEVINIHVKSKITHFKACAEVILYTNINNPITTTNPTNVSLNAYSYLCTI